MSEEINGLLSEHLKKLGSKGGKAGTLKQTEARRKALMKARATKYGNKVAVRKDQSNG